MSTFFMFNFSKVHNGKINRDFVLSNLSDSTIFSKYFGNFKLREVYPSVFRKDRNPSTGFYMNKTGKVVYNDIATGEKLDCFAFVAKLHNITYGEAIKKIARDFGLIESNNVVYNPAEVYEVEDDFVGKTLIQIKPDKWNESYLAYWRQYEITQEELTAENNIFPVKELYINKRRIFNESMRFACVEHWKEEEFVKVYSPKDTEMKWVSNVPLYVPFGYESLPCRSDTVIITKSFKDRLVLKKIFTDVCATQNESESALIPEVQEKLLKNYKNRIIIFDNDKVGVESCKKFNEKGFSYFNIPKEYNERFGIKDCSDFISWYGLDALKDLLKEKNIIP